eukprot:715830-Prymnesium_polylepis.1
MLPPPRQPPPTRPRPSLRKREQVETELLRFSPTSSVARRGTVALVPPVTRIPHPTPRRLGPRTGCCDGPAASGPDHRAVHSKCRCRHRNTHASLARGRCAHNDAERELRVCPTRPDLFTRVN